MIYMFKKTFLIAFFNVSNMQLCHLLSLIYVTGKYVNANPNVNKYKLTLNKCPSRIVAQSLVVML